MAMQHLNTFWNFIVDKTFCMYQREFSSAPIDITYFEEQSV